MAKDKKHIDDLFKDQFNGGQLPLDGTEWDKLYAELHPGKKRRFAWWWWGLALAVVLGGTGLVYTLTQNDDVTVVAGNDNSNNNSNVGEGISSNGGSNASSPEQENANSGSTSASSSTSNGSKNASEEINGNNGSAVSSPGRENANSGSNSNPGANSNTNPNSGSSSASTSTSASTSDDKGTPNVEKIVIDRDNLSGVRGEVQVSPIENVNLPVNSIWPLAQKYIGPFMILRDTAAKSSNRTWIDPYVGFSLGATNYAQQLSSNDQIYLSRRQLNESSVVLPNFSFDIGGEYKGINFQSGLGYETKGQTNAARFNYVLYDSIPHRNTQGDTIGWAPWNYRDTTIDRRLDNPRYSYITLPVNVGKSFHLGYTDFTLDVGINGSVQYLVQARGYILSPQLRPVNVQQLNGFNRLNLTYGGYLGMGYAVSDRLKLQLITRYNIDGRSMINNTGTQKMQGFGGNLSVQFKLKE